MNYIINDVRDASFFKVSTFSQYKKQAVKEELLKALKNSQLEPACFWTTEMVCSGQFIDLWEIILFFFGKHVHMANPKLAIYLEFRFNAFKTNIAQHTDPLELRNVLPVRQLFAEIIAVLCFSAKRPGIDQVKVKKEDLNLMTSGVVFKAPNSEYAKPFFQQGDPVEVYAPLNEVCYALSTKQILTCCYWIEWVVLYERTKKPPPTCVPRDYVDHKKCNSDLIWMVWEILIAYAPEGIASKIANATFNLFRLHYTSSVNEKRRFLMYFVVTLCCDPIDQNAPMLPDAAELKKVIDKHNLFYKDIQKNSIRLSESAAK